MAGMMAGLRAAIYARHSTEMQAGSVEAQLDRCRGWVVKQGGAVVAEYADRARSGSTLAGRDEMERLLAEAGPLGIDAVVAEDLSRFSRALDEIALIYKLLRHAGARLFTCVEGEIGTLHIGLKGTMNELFLSDLSDKIRRGKRAALLQGRYQGGTVPYGYERVYDLLDDDGRPQRGQLGIVPAEAGIVTRIYRQYLATGTIMAVVHALNGDRVPRSGGGLWTREHLVRDGARPLGILQNPIYRGEIFLGRLRTIRHPTTGKRLHQRRRKSDLVTAAVPHLQIIDEGVWRKAQELLVTRRRYRPRRPSGPKAKAPPPPPPPRKNSWYVTSERLRCADCGDAVVAANALYVQCRRWRDDKACTQRFVMRRADVGVLVVRALQRRLGPRRNAVNGAVSREAARMRRAALAADVELQELHADRERWRERTARVVRLLADGDGGIAARGELRSYEKRVRELTAAIQGKHRAARKRAPPATAAARREIAVAATAALRRALDLLLGDPAHEEAVAVVRGALSHVNVGYAGPGRTGLRVRPRLDAAAVYRLGVRNRSNASP